MTEVEMRVWEGPDGLYLHRDDVVGYARLVSERIGGSSEDYRDLGPAFVAGARMAMEMIAIRFEDPTDEDPGVSSMKVAVAALEQLVNIPEGGGDSGDRDAGS